MLEDEDLLVNVNRMGAILRTCLREAFANHPNIGDIRGRGLMVGIELVENRETRAGIRKELGV
ncbi:MAG: aminotransferase class III-fold pyridoxal phosphate-dependent enzyme, partial [Gammaproteobacteria bacterium]|nr:aminotransferase class III-fold pyridoxal phosphate-dependent enzyme [Gammaproteobacteria bacterium]